MMPVTRLNNALDAEGDCKTQSEKPEGKLASAGKKRTRTGCLNCRRKRRKCDENKPTCEGCKGRRETCQWGVKVSFRPEHAQMLDSAHPSMRRAAGSSKSQAFQIVNVTSEIIRDYCEEFDVESNENTSTLEEFATQNEGNINGGQEHERRPDITFASPSITASLPDDGGLLSLNADIDFLSSPSVFDDGIFVPGSQYQELHAALRSRIISTARSTVPSRVCSVEPEEQIPLPAISRSVSAADNDDEESRRLAHLSPEQEYILWQNYINEVASWCDKFDNNRHFELVLPMIAKSHPHLKFSILALSARQMELRDRTPDNSCSLALYQHAIHLLSPLLQTRTTTVLASCVVLAVLEMVSCSPKAWRRHLDGCAALIQALGISGCCGGLEQALFWTFARMDICGSFISSERTLIPIDRWIGQDNVSADLETFRSGSFDMYANHIIYLCGRVVELLCSSGNWSKSYGHRSGIAEMVNDTEDWLALFELVEAWNKNRSEEMKPILTIPTNGQDPTKVFPTVLFGNGPATSGNQMYHTAALLMLKYKPSNVQLAKKPRSMLWHARQICSISISNTHHGCWTNSTQPLWIAGQLMSHPSEHHEILKIYERIERETGWSTKWRADDLREYWGDDNE